MSYEIEIDKLDESWVLNGENPQPAKNGCSCV